MDWTPIDRYVQKLERELGDRYRAEGETRTRLTSGELLAEGRRGGETAAGWVPIPRGWWPRRGMIGGAFVDYALCMTWMNAIRGTRDSYLDVRVCEANAQLDLVAAIKRLDAEGARPGAGMQWEGYARSIEKLTKRGR